MPTWLQWSLIAAGLATAALLAFFIARQLTRLRTQRIRSEKNRAFQAQRRQQMIDSIRVLAQAVEEDQVEYSEACLRLKGLLDHVAPDLLSQPPFQVFQDVHDRIQHMPTHRARQSTEPKFLEKMDQERFAVEEEFSDNIRRAATTIRYHEFPSHWD